MSMNLEKPKKGAKESKEIIKSGWKSEFEKWNEKLQ